MILKLPILSKTQRKYRIFFKHFNYSKLNFQTKLTQELYFALQLHHRVVLRAPGWGRHFYKTSVAWLARENQGLLFEQFAWPLPVFRILTLILELSSFIPSRASLMRESVDLSEVGGGSVKPFIHHSCTSRQIFISILTPEKAYLVRCVWL